MVKVNIVNNFIKKVYLSKGEYESLESKDDISYDRRKQVYYKNEPMDVSDAHGYQHPAFAFSPTDQTT